MPDVRDMVAAQLKLEGFDGLFNDISECSCELGDLEPCGEMNSSCEAGYKKPGCNCGENHDFHMVATKEELTEEDDE